MHPNPRAINELVRRIVEAIYPKPRLSQAQPEHRVYPYVLRGVPMTHVNRVWRTDITSIRLHGGFIYLVAVMDWFSRYVLSWEVSNLMEATFCVEALQRALGRGRPEIFNTDQGSQFTAEQFTGSLERAGIKISMDGRGRALDNVMVERLWRTVKYEDVYLRDYADGAELRSGLARYFRFYNTARPHQALGKQTPAEVHFG